MTLLPLKNITASCLVACERFLGIRPLQVSVLCYHSVCDEVGAINVPVKNFLTQIQFLRSYGFDFITLDQVMEFIKDKSLPNQKPCIALTFDDGYEDIMEHVLPLLGRLTIPAAFFVLPRPERAERPITEHRRHLLSANQIQYIHRLGFTIGSHTMTHRNLLKISVSEYKKEINRSKQQLEHLLHTNIMYFAYPQGSYNSEAIDAVRQAGYKGAFSIDAGIISPGTNPFTVPRLCVNARHSLEQFSAFFTHLGTWYLEFTKKQQVDINKSEYA